LSELIDREHVKEKNGDLKGRPALEGKRRICWATELMVSWGSAGLSQRGRASSAPLGRKGRARRSSTSKTRKGSRFGGKKRKASRSTGRTLLIFAQSPAPSSLPNMRERGAVSEKNDCRLRTYEGKDIIRSEKEGEQRPSWFSKTAFASSAGKKMLPQAVENNDGLSVAHTT